MAIESSNLENNLARLKSALDAIPEEAPVSSNPSKGAKLSPLQNSFLPQQSILKHAPGNSAVSPPGILNKSPLRNKSIKRK